MKIIKVYCSMRSWTRCSSPKVINFYVIIIVLTILDIPSFLKKKANTKKLDFKLAKHLNSLTTISFKKIEDW